MNGLLATSLLTLLAGTSDVQWIDNYGKALEATKTSERPLLVVIEHSQNTVAAESSDSETLGRYVLCRIDAATPYGQKVAKAFKTTSFPHTAVIDKTGSKILYRKTGEFTVSTWNHMLVSYQEGNLPTEKTYMVGYQGATQSESQPAVRTPPTSSNHASPVRQTTYQPTFNFQPRSTPSFSISSPARCFT